MRREFYTACVTAVLAAAMFAACGSALEKTGTTEGTSVQASGETQKTNHYGLSAEEAKKFTGMTLQVPDGAADVKYNVIDADSDKPMLEMEFKMDGTSYYMRVRTTDQTSVFPDEMGMDEMGAAGDGTLVTGTFVPL